MGQCTADVPIRQFCMGVLSGTGYGTGFFTAEKYVFVSWRTSHIDGGRPRAARWAQRVSCSDRTVLFLPDRAEQHKDVGGIQTEESVGSCGRDIALFRHLLFE